MAQVLLRWEPNPDQEQMNVKLGYHVKINAPQEDEVSVLTLRVNFNLECILLIEANLTEKKEAA